jgi:ferric-dicitrate binding protein FerR (iron transport regulator)
LLPNHLIRLITRKLTNEANLQELQELESAIRENPQAQNFYDIFTSYWSSKPDVTQGVKDHLSEAHFNYILQSASADNAEETFNEEVPVVTLNPIRVWFKRIAAAAVIIGLGTGSYFYYNSLSQKKNNTPDNYRNEVVAKPGVRSKMLLPDGTVVWLNSQSKLAYSNSFNNNLREVHLEGEAFFEVAKDSSRPFIVHTSDIDIKVLGTAFNVKSYEKEKTIETTLIHGSIEVLNKQHPKAPKVILKPHEKLVFQKDQQHEAAEAKNATPGGKPVKAEVLLPGMAIAVLPKNLPDSAMKETSWVYNKLIFEGENFRELASKMERWFNVKISFQDQKITAYRFRGVFGHENISEALQALQLTASFNFKINNNEVYIYK